MPECPSAGLFSDEMQEHRKPPVGQERAFDLHHFRRLLFSGGLIRKKKKNHPDLSTLRTTASRKRGREDDGMRVQPRGMVERKKEYRGRNRERGERGGGGDQSGEKKKESGTTSKTCQ